MQQNYLERLIRVGRLVCNVRENDSPLNPQTYLRSTKPVVKKKKTNKSIMRHDHKTFAKSYMNIVASKKR